MQVGEFVGRKVDRCTKHYLILPTLPAIVASFENYFGIS